MKKFWIPFKLIWCLIVKVKVVWYIHVLQAVVYLPFIAVGLILLRWSYELFHTNVTVTLSYLELKRFGVYVSDFVTRILRILKVVLIEWASSNFLFISYYCCNVQQKLVKEDRFRFFQTCCTGVHVIWSAVHDNITGYLLYVSFWGLTAWIESFETLISHCIW